MRRLARLSCALRPVAPGAACGSTRSRPISIRRRARLGDWSASDSRLLCVGASSRALAVWGGLLLLGIAASRDRSLGGGARSRVARRIGAGRRAILLRPVRHLPQCRRGSLRSRIPHQCSRAARGPCAAACSRRSSVPVVASRVLAVVARKWMRPAYRSSRLATYRGAPSGRARLLCSLARFVRFKPRHRT